MRDEEAMALNRHINCTGLQSVVSERNDVSLTASVAYCRDGYRYQNNDGYAQSDSYRHNNSGNDAHARINLSAGDMQ
jgi:hypothetical protein